MTSNLCTAKIKRKYLRNAQISSGFEWFFVKVQLSGKEVASAPAGFAWL